MGKNAILNCNILGARAERYMKEMEDRIVYKRTNQNSGVSCSFSMPVDKIDGGEIRVPYTTKSEDETIEEEESS